MTIHQHNQIQHPLLDGNSYLFQFFYCISCKNSQLVRNSQTLCILLLSLSSLLLHFHYFFHAFFCIIHYFISSLLFSTASCLSSSFSSSYVFIITLLSLDSNAFAIALVFDEHNLLALVIIFVMICFFQNFIMFRKFCYNLRHVKSFLIIMHYTFNYFIVSIVHVHVVATLSSRTVTQP